MEALPSLVGGHFHRLSWLGRIHGLAVWSADRIVHAACALSLPASRLPGRLPRRRAQIVQVGEITFANVHLSHGQLLNRRQLARIAASLRGKPSAIIGDYNAVGPILLPGLHRCRSARADALRQQRHAVPSRPLPGAWAALPRRRHARLRSVRPSADRLDLHVSTATAKRDPLRGTRPASPGSARHCASDDFYR